jgi:alginate O-acetyltransferase complex protein AlgI
MNIVGLPYFIFLFAVLLFYWNLTLRKQNILLLTASCFFYACWDWRLLGLLIIVTALNFIIGDKINSAASQVARKKWLYFALIVNLMILGYFKYKNFMIWNFTEMLHLFKWNISNVTTQIILPVGISFYIFQALTYPLDIYNRKLKPIGSFLDFAVFVTFFPKLIAGPIVRARDFLPQLEKKRSFHWNDFQAGFIRILTGYFKKAFIADTLALYLVTPVFNDPASYSTGSLWLAMVGYAVQIYADFSGYSSMAIGTAKILGLEIQENFLFPYLAINFSDFWRRWHITMSSFFRDYVYIPMGGSRCKRPRVFLNLMVTMILCGLWHGPAWTFVLWGGVHGLYLILNHFTVKQKVGPETRVMRENAFITIAASWLLTQLLVSFAWVLFRAKDIESAALYFKGLFGSAGQKTIAISSLIACCFAAVIVDHVFGWLDEHKPELVTKIGTNVEAVIYTILIIFLFHALPEKSNPFIYFQF